MYRKTNFNETAGVGDLSAISLASVLDQSADCVKLISLAGTVEYMNANGQCSMEIDDFCAVQGRAWTELWPAEAQGAIAAAYDEAAAGNVARFSAFCPTAKGSPRWWDVSVSPVANDAGQLAGYLSVSRDVTESQQNREAMTIAAAELRHRLKNTYQIIGSLLVVTARGTPALEQFASQMNARLRAISAAQVLFAEDDKPCRLHELIPALVDPFASELCRVVIGNLPDVPIAQAQADAAALVVGELAVNSSKHGAFAHGGSITLEAACADALLTIAWHERCDRPVERRGREGGQGMRLMEQIMRARGGKMIVEWEHDGLTATFSFQLDT